MLECIPYGTWYIKTLFRMYRHSLNSPMFLADNSIIATAIPKITDQFDSLDDIGWYGSGMFFFLLQSYIYRCKFSRLTHMQPTC